MEDIMHLSTSTSVLQTAFAVGIGLVITVVYLTRKRKNNGKSKTKNNNSSQNKFPSKASVEDSNQVKLISGQTSHKLKNCEDKDLEREIAECRTLISNLERQIEFERSKRNESESFCGTLEKELQTERRARQQADVKYEKLLKRYEVVSVKLKAAEERCKKLMDQLNNVDSDIEEDSLDEEDDVQEEDVSYEETPPLTPEIKQTRATDLKAVGVKTPEFELEMNVMEALVGAVMDIEEDDCDNDCDNDSLTDLLLNNMSEDDLDDSLKGDEKLNNSFNTIAEEALIYDAMQTVNNTKQFWEQFSRTDSCYSRTPDIPEFTSQSDDISISSDLCERSSPFLELQQRWSSQSSLKNADRHSNEDINVSQSTPNFRTIDDYVKEDGGHESVFKVGRLKRQWEKMAITEES